jgi:NAD(P)H-flavin reductase
MPKTVRLAVRFSHAIGGLAVTLLGPMVVWNGFIRLRPFVPSVDFFESTPIVWFSVLIGLVTFSLLAFIKSLGRSKRDGPQLELETERKDLETNLPSLTIADAIDIIRSDKRSVYVFDGDFLVRVPKDKTQFDHPGGLALITAHEGKDIAGIFRSVEPFSDSGRQRFHEHTAQALKILLSLRVGRVSGPVCYPGESSSTVMGGTQFSLDESMGGPMFSIDEEGRSLGRFLSKEQMNTSSSFPVLRLTFEVCDFILTSTLSPGMKIRVSLHDVDSDTSSYVTRTYTVVAFDSAAKRMDLLMKIYPEGALTSKLSYLQQGDFVNLSGVTCPPFPRIFQLSGGAKYLLLAGGTGILPLLYYVERFSGEIVVLWSLRFYEDAFLIEEMKSLLTKPNVTLIVHFTGETELKRDFVIGVVKLGRIEMAEIQQPEQMFCVMSGPSDFVSAVHTQLTDRGVPAQKILSLD